MARTYRRMLALCLALVLVLGCLPCASQAEAAATVHDWVSIQYRNIAVGGGTDGNHFTHVTTVAGLQGGVLFGANKGAKAALVAVTTDQLIDYQNDNEFEPDKKATGIQCHWASSHDEEFSHPDAVWWFEPQSGSHQYRMRTEVNGVSCYLTGNTLSGTVGLTTDISKATVWTVRINSSEDALDNETNENIGFVVYLTGTGDKPYYHLYFNDSTPRGFQLEAQKELDTGGDYLFEAHKPGAVNRVSTYAARLTEQVITYPVGTQMDAITASIHTDCSIDQSSQADYTGASPLSWEDETVTLDTSNIDPSQPGTYQAPVYVQGVFIGDVPVVITPPSFTGTLAPVSTVVDYGKAVTLPLLEGSDLQGYTAQVLGLVEYTAVLGTEAQNGTYPASLNGKYGSFSLSGNEITYTPTHIVRDTERVLCVVRLRYGETAAYDRYLYQSVTVIPANIMYYETDIGGITLNGAWETITEGTSDYVQSPGNGNDDTYGYDPSYDNDSQLSNGTSWFAVGIFDSAAKTYPVSAEFDFAGTGIDIISRTGPNQGTVRITVTGSNGYEKSMSVCNKGETPLYQIPAFTLRTLNGLDTYHVKIVVYPPVNYGPDFEYMNVGGEFYFDAIRIYNTTDSAEANDAYAQAGQAHSLIQRIRDILIPAGTFAAGGMAEDDAAIFIDYDPDGNLKQEYDVASYQKYGPNHELYLGTNQAVAFQLGWSNAPASLDIAAKAVETKKAHLTVTLKSTAGDTLGILDREIASCTAQYFDLLDSLNGDMGNKVYVVIRNTGEGILSVTDLKTAYASADEQPVSIRANRQTLAAARDTMQCQLYSAEFSAETVRLASLTTLTVFTSQEVDMLELRDANGNTLWHTEICTDTGIGRVWTVLLRPALLGDSTYTVTGYSEDPNCQPGSISAGIQVTF